jgi:hypothetical protein
MHSLMDQRARDEGYCFQLNFVRIVAVLLVAGLLISAHPVYGCEVAQIMFGKITLDIIPQKDYETALIRHGDFNNPKLNFGAFKGEITVDRGGFSIRNNNQETVGIITPELRVEGSDDDCDKTQKIIIRKVQAGAYVIMNGNTPVGTIEGRFPKNSFGVR